MAYTEHMAQKDTETVNHPAHYGGADNPYEAIKVIEAWNLNFCLGNTVKYIARHGKKHRRGADISEARAKLEDLKKAAWYLNREIENLQRGPEVKPGGTLPTADGRNDA